MTKKKAKAPSRLKPLPFSAAMEWNAALRAIERRKWGEAREALESLNGRFPRRADVLRLLASVCGEQSDVTGSMTACRQLVELVPDDGDIWLALAVSYMMHPFPMLALQTFEEFLRRFPDHEDAAKTRRDVMKLRPEIADVFAQSGLTPEDSQIAVWHEEINVFVETGQRKAARRTAEKLLQQRPDFVPALNNLSQILSLDGEYTGAIALSQRVLQGSPGNIHALSNLTRFCVFAGRCDEAQKWAVQLKASRERGFDVSLKKVEALAYLGDDAGVLEIAADARARKIKQSPGADAMMAHLAAVSAWRLGQEGEARGWWKIASRDAANPMIETVRENLSDLKKPAGERHAPWPFSFGYWIREATIQELLQNVKTTTGPGGRGKAWRSPEAEEAAFQHKMKRYLENHPEIEALLPLLLERGDPAGRQFALMIANTARTPAALKALSDFALSPWGPDSMRHQAAQTALETGVLPRSAEGAVTMWWQGEQRELILTGLELHDESDLHLDRATQDLANKAHDLLRDGDSVAAEMLLQNALERCPDDPALRYNYLTALEGQGRCAEADRLIEQLFQEHPEYLFGRLALARLKTRLGDFEAAQELLKPMSEYRRLHFSEFVAWYIAQIELFLAQEMVDAALQYLQMMEEMVPGHPVIAPLRKKINAAKKKR